jgi:imidazolonepropionase-like amidohydrolase
VPARFMGLDDRLGSIGKGKTASMILLRANPLEDVRNAREIEAVFLRGRYYDRKALDHLLEEARDLAKR